MIGPEEPEHRVLQQAATQIDASLAWLGCHAMRDPHLRESAQLTLSVSDQGATCREPSRK